MLVNHGDQPVMQKAQLGGGRSVFEPSCAPAYWCVAMPSPFHVARALGAPGSQPPNATAFPWAARTSKAWWRGELAVPDHTLRSTLLTLPRLKVLSIARQRPDLMDVRLSGLDHDSLEHALGADDIGARAHDLLLAAGLDEAEANAVASGENYAPFATHGPRFRFQLSLHAVISSWRLHGSCSRARRCCCRSTPSPSGSARASCRGSTTCPSPTISATWSRGSSG